MEENKIKKLKVIYINSNIGNSMDRLEDSQIEFLEELSLIEVFQLSKYSLQFQLNLLIINGEKNDWKIKKNSLVELLNKINSVEDLIRMAIILEYLKDNWKGDKSMLRKVFKYFKHQSNFLKNKEYFLESFGIDKEKLYQIV